MDDRHTTEDALQTLRDSTPPPHGQSAARQAFLAHAARLRETQTVSGAPVVRPKGWRTQSSMVKGLRTGANGMHPKRFGWWTLTGVILLFMLTVGVVFGQEIVRFFTRSADDQGSTQIYYNPDHDMSDPYPLALDDAVQAADFEVLIPGFIPPNFQFDGAFYAPEGRYLALNYRCGNMRAIGIAQNPVPPDEVQSIESEVGASAVIESVRIGSAVGQYVRGAWRVVGNPDLSDDGLGPETPVAAETVWENNSEFQRLIWYQDGILYRIETTSGSLVDDGTAGRCALDKTDFINIAQGLNSP